MYVVSKGKDQIVNLDNTLVVFASKDDLSIKVNFPNGSGCQLAVYSQPVAHEVIAAVGRAIGKTDVYFLPDDLGAQALIAQNREVWHHATGKKTKGHGGS